MAEHHGEIQANATEAAPPLGICEACLRDRHEACIGDECDCFGNEPAPSWEVWSS